MSARFRLDPNVAAVSAALLLVTLGENLWLKFVPKYLQALGAPVLAVGLYGSLRDLLDGLYQYPGGWAGDRFGRRTALTLFIAIAMCGYGAYLAAPSWPFVIAGLALVMAWASMASPTVFAVVGDALPKGKRAIGFTVQALVKRVPLTVAPLIGGVVIARSGVVRGVRGMLVITLIVAALALVAARRIALPPVPADALNIRGVWRTFPHSLRMLLVADIFARTCEGLVDVFLVIWATNVAHLSAAQFGVLVSIQSLTSLLVYLPAARFADYGGRKPVVIATFLCFAAFPVAVVSAHSFGALIGAFVVGGLREVGEPSRKSLIVDFADASCRARSVGLYYLLRSATIAPAAAIGGALWNVAPPLPFYTAGSVGILGAIVFALAVRE
ncbi:MAG TPA: MFS transporter [Thermoanaerobaculia bacterium]|jgi:MFS family permease